MECCLPFNKSWIVKTIVEHRRIIFPGEKLNNRQILLVRNLVYGKGLPPIYLSPSIKYECFEYYGKSYLFKEKRVKVVIQCRIKPGSYKMLGNYKKWK